LDVSIAGATYAITVDNGSAYTWVTQRVGRAWIEAHPDWERGVGAVGPSNMMMSGGLDWRQCPQTLSPDARLSESHDVLAEAGGIRNARSGPGGLTLRSDNGAFYVAAIATKNGRPTVKGVFPGDNLLQVGDVELSSATWGKVFQAMHGSTGQSRTLVVERNGVRVRIVEPITSF
jgi:hypothetical protein